MAIYTVLFSLLSHPVLTCVFIPITVLVLRALYRVSPFHPLSHIPGPLLPRLSSLWLTYHAWSGDEASLVHSLHQIYGPIVRTGPDSVDIADGAALAAIYHEKGGFGKVDFYANFDIDGHKSIFSETDPTNRAPRAKAVAGLFSTSSLRQGQDIIYQCVDRFVARLSEGKKEDRRGRPLNVLNFTRGLAVDAVSSYLLGKTYGALDEDGTREEKQAVQKEGSGSGPARDDHMSASGMVDCFVAVGRFWYLPPWAFKIVESLDAWWNAEPGVSNSLDVVDAFVARVVDDAEGVIRASESNDEKSTHPSTSYPARLLQAGFTPSETRAQCKDLIFAGTDSTGMNLATILFLLAKNPTVYATLRDELKTAGDPRFDDLQSLPYLRGVVKEGLRLSMANPSRLPRVVPAQGWTFKSTHFPAGTVVSCTPYSLHLNPDVFPDPTAFKPERWQEPSEEMMRDAIPFGLGSRQCIARNLATVELFCAVERVVRADVLQGARTVKDKIEILEWFNSKVIGERVDLVWK
ncbi:uncharacterized protein Z518_00150 [Rhinocladiella mackenziei CBS 650.93]|uniref:Cytochrome P450 n=1 Tax=Rhinocladiella mackenziei CBS 650.93 TaxID=1442369 RepID=A0A0D2G3E7_9EURO|nr:uncharacterized protein Z518_00150 [Rhinocladiella mackenziei CBS 650.93]KIX09072.1 hypothetical protein Z518_00150 [Rhinocladiella mackenziei CBS 650.93]